MKILIISQYFFPESFRINDIAGEWVKRGYDVSVVTGIPNYPEGRFYKGYSLLKKRKEDVNGVMIHRIPIVPRGRTKIGILLNYLSFMISGVIWANTTRMRPDIIFSFETSPMTQVLVGTRLAKRRKRPHILYIQDLWPENVMEVGGVHTPLIIKPLDSMVKKIYRNADLILATSPSFVKMIRQRMESDKKCVKQIPEDKVVYWPQYAEDFYKPILKDQSDNDSGIFKIVFSGNIGYAQGLEILPDCALRLSQMKLNRNIRFILVGDGRARDDLTSKIADLGLTDMFEFMGRKKPEEIPKILSGCDAAFLSFTDNALFAATIPAKLQSYMACAMPIIAVATGETRRIIDESGCGICTDPGDSKALTESIVSFMEMSKNEIDIMSNKSIGYFQTNFDKNDLMDRMDGFIKKVGCIN